MFNPDWHCKGKPYRAVITPLNVRLPNQDEADERIDTIVQPDVFGVCDPNKPDRRGVRGAPDYSNSPYDTHHLKFRTDPMQINIQNRCPESPVTGYY